MVKIITGDIPSARLIPRSKWKSVINEWRSIAAIRFDDDCRALLQMRTECRELRMWEELGYDSEDQFFEKALVIKPEAVELACLAIQANQGQPIGIKQFVEQARRQADLESDEYVGQGTRSDKQLRDNVTKSRQGGNELSYTLRRLARSHPELLDRVESGELSANAAAIEAGFRHKTITVRLDDAQSAVRTLLRHYTKEQLRKAINAD